MDEVNNVLDMIRPVRVMVDGDGVYQQVYDFTSKDGVIDAAVFELRKPPNNVILFEDDYIGLGITKAKICSSLLILQLTKSTIESLRRIASFNEGE